LSTGTDSPVRGELLYRQLALPPGADDVCARLEHVAQRQHGPLGPCLLEEPKKGVH
jgi:hypothetical protein